MAKRRAKVFYFTRHDDDLWEVIQSLPDGDGNHEIRKALRAYFLDEPAQRKYEAKKENAEKEEAAPVQALESKMFGNKKL